MEAPAHRRRQEVTVSDLLLSQILCRERSFYLYPHPSPIAEYDGPPHSMVPAFLLSATLAGKYLLIIVHAGHWGKLGNKSIRPLFISG